MGTTQSSDTLLNQLVARAHNLYTLPTVASRVLELTRTPELDTRVLRDCIERDPALTSKLLRVVNSSLFALSREVSDLNHAIALLGTKPLKLLVLGFSLPCELFSGVDIQVLRRYWKQSLVKAVAAREISEQFWRATGEEAFISALLQNIGMLVLIQQLGEPYRQFLNGVDGGSDLLELEKARLGFNHTTLSARLLEDWELPRIIVANVEMPYDSDRIMAMPRNERFMPQVLHLADLTATLLTQNAPNTLNELLQVGHKYDAGLTIRRIHELVDSLDQKVQSLAETLDVKVLPPENYLRILQDAMSQMSVLADDAAVRLTRHARGGGDAGSRKEEGSPEPSLFEGAAGDAGRDRRQRLAASGIADEDDASADWDQSSTTTAVAESHDAPDSVSVAGSAEVLSYSEVARQISSVLSACRQAQRALSLVLLEIDEFEELVLSHGGEKTASIIRSFSNAVARLVGKEGDVLHVGDRRWTIILQGYERQQAVHMIRAFHDEVRCWFRQREAITQRTITVSFGVASLTIPPRNLAPLQLIEAAEGCLEGAQLQGGDVLKSIELY